MSTTNGTHAPAPPAPLVPPVAYYPCTHGPCSCLGTRHELYTPTGSPPSLGKCRDCPCIEFRPWGPPPLLPDHTQEEHQRRAAQWQDRPAQALPEEGRR
jgi:hypothetical protein